MCGVVGGWDVDVAAGLAALRHRGPDGEGQVELPEGRGGGLVLGHARLAVLDPTPGSAQPMRRGHVTLSYNGELWNHAGLRRSLELSGRTFSTPGDTEVVAVALDELGDAALRCLEGMFAMAWHDDRDPGVVRLARDRFGEVPLHFGQKPDAGVGFASEVKALLAAGCGPRTVGDVGPGEVVTLSQGSFRARKRWYDPPAEPLAVGRSQAAQLVREALERAVRERAIADVPVCTLLSGGVDSACVAALLKRHVPGLVAFTAVHNPQSADLRSARKTAAALGLPLREVRVPAPDASDLARTVRTIELPHKAQVEIGWACLHLAEAARAEGFKVTFSGEGADELFASYGFSHHGVARMGWHAYRKHLFLDQARKNFPRCNKAFLSRGVECRLPFLHTPLVELLLSLPEEAARDRSPGGAKAALRDACADLLPAHVLTRPKVAFQDGAGLKAACARAVADPARFYRLEHQAAFGGWKP